MSLRESLETNKTAEVIIVGAGVIGLSIARALAERGMRDVALIERAKPGAEASWAAGGILAPQIEADSADDFFRLACASRDMYPSFAADLKEETGIDVQFDQAGTLYLGFTEDDECELRRRYDWQTNEAFSVEWLSGDAARKLEPNISQNTRCALRFPNDWQVENRWLVKALVSANEKLGVRLISACELTSLRIEGAKVSGVETSSGFISTTMVVLACGAWTSLIQSSGPALPAINVEPVRGQMLCFATRPAVARHVLYSSRGYLIPRRDGRVLAGSTTETTGFDKHVTAEGIDAIKSMAAEIAPVFQRLRLIDSWAGLRPRAQDSLPVIGCYEEIKGLLYAAGHYRNGILLAPLTGELIADIVTGVPMPPSSAAFSPNRFHN